MSKSWRKRGLGLGLSNAAPTMRSAIWDQTSDGAIAVDDRGMVVDLNPAAARMLSRAPAEIVGQPLALVFPAWNDLVTQCPDSAERRSEVWLGTGKAQRCFELRASPLLDRRNRSLGWLTLLRDITEHKQAEEKLHRLDLAFEHLSDSLVFLDPEGHVVDCNPATTRMFGCTKKDLLGKRPAFWSMCGDPGTWLAQIDEGLHREQRWSGEMTYLRPDGSKGMCEVLVVPLCNQEGQPALRAVVSRDISAHKQTELSLKAQVQLFEGLVAVARATAEQSNLETTLQNALDVMATLTQAESGSLFLLDETGAGTPSFVALGGTTKAEQQDTARLALERGLAGWVVRHRQMALIQDTTADDRWLELDSSPPARSALAVPIASGMALLGVLTLVHPTAGHFSTEHSHLVQAAADQMALAIQNAESFDAQRRMANRQATLYKVLTTVGRYLDTATLTSAAAETIAWLTGWPVVAVLLPNEVGDCLRIQAVEGIPFFGEGWSLPIDQSIAGRAFRLAQTQYVPDVSADVSYMGKRVDSGCELAIPLRRGEQVLGVLALQSDHTHAFDGDDTFLAESLAEAIGLALANASLYADIHQHLADLNTLYTITRVIGRSLALEDVLEKALLSILISLDYDAGLIALVDPSGARLRILAEHGLSSTLSRRLQQEGLENTVCAYVHERHESLVISGFDQDMTASLSALMAKLNAPELRACASVPLMQQDESLGVLCMFAHHPRRLTTNEMILLETIGRHIATAVLNARLFRATVDERQRLVTLLESSRDGIAFVGMDRRIHVMNAAALASLALPGQPEDWMNRPLKAALVTLRHRAPSALEALSPEAARIQTGDEPPGEGEFRVSTRTIHWLNLPVLAGSTPLGRLLFLRDVTEERLLDEMRQDLTHTMVHDLRNPLTSLAMALQLLSEPDADPLSPDQRVMIEYARTSLRKMLTLVNNILDVNRLEDGRMPMTCAAVSVPDLIAETVQEQSLLALQKAIRLQSQISSILPPVWADAQLVGRVLQNLVGNAIKFTPTDGLIQVTAELGAYGNSSGARASEVRISVADTGPGISPELRDRLFQKFASGHHDQSGSGLGLAFCKLVVEAHQGRIWVESEQERGATFCFTLPIAPHDAPETAAANI